MKRRSTWRLGLGLTWLAAITSAAPLRGSGFEQFIQNNVRLGGFIENATGLAVSDGSGFFDTSNRFDMNRLTIQPELNVNFSDEWKLLVAWKFVKEPRYAMEARSRKQSVQPSAGVGGLSNRYYDEYSPVPWEAVLDYIPSDRLTLRWGRQFISWGETDGIRLLDLINPQDGTFAPPAAPNLFNLDETRIPSWGLRGLYTVRPESNTIVEVFALPGALDRARHRVDEVMGSNDTGDRTIKYGRWSSHPETRIAFGRLFANPLGAVPVVVPVSQRELPESADSWKFGGRLTHNLAKLNFALGYIWGYNPQAADMVFKMKGQPVLCGPPRCPPNGTKINLALVNGRGHSVAGQFNYPIGEVMQLPVNSTLRGEVVVLPHKPYNIAAYPGRNCQTGTATGVRAGPSCRYPDGVVDKHTLRYALGLDRTTLIPLLHPDDPWRAFNLSVQLFQSVIFNHEDGIRPFSSMERIERISTTLTFRAGTGYLGDTILPDVFFAYDPEGYYAINPALSYAPPGNENLRFTLTAVIYGGRNKFKSFGFFDEKDSVFFKVRYQF